MCIIAVISWFYYFEFVFLLLIMLFVLGPDCGRRGGRLEALALRPAIPRRRHVLQPRQGAVDAIHPRAHAQDSL